MSYASEALSMPVCFAFTGKLLDEWGGDVMDAYTCQECGWPYWSHSHRLNRSNRRDKNVLIPAREARSFYNYARRKSYEGRGWRVGAFPYPAPDTRPRYDMMMDRTPGVCEWVERVSARQFDNITFPITTEMHSLNRERYDQDGNFLR